MRVETTENWLPVKRYEGIYEVSDLGNVRSLDRVIPMGKSGKTFKKVEGKVLALYHMPKRHSRITFTYSYKTETFNVCNLVYETFRGPIPKGHQVVHKNGDARDNSLKNLELREFVNEELEGKRKRNNTGKLTDDQVRQIRKLYDEENKKILEIAKILEIGEQVVRRAATRKSYLWVDKI
jgi:bisphosphoglycerate-dependent phosphoglycerate mutase